MHCSAGIPRWNIILDPGLGFAKTGRRLFRLHCAAVGWPWKLRPPSASFVRVRPEGRGGRLAGRRCGAALHAWHRDSHALACAQHAGGERRGEWLHARQRSTTSRSSIICAACKQRVRTGSFRRKPRPAAAGPRQTHSSLPRPVGLCSPRLAAARLVSTPFVCRSRKLPCARFGVVQCALVESMSFGRCGIAQLVDAPAALHRRLAQGVCAEAGSPSRAVRPSRCSGAP